MNIAWRQLSPIAQPAQDGLRADRPGSTRLRYIDGLRAVAIVAVVAFHAKVPGFSGGYVGVDIFFVISGFLITNQIVVQALAGRFSAADFYARRATRILPPLFIVMVVVLGCDRLLPLLPEEFADIDRSAAATAAMISNFYFVFAGAEYFSQISEVQPFLHTWSLGLEEQYYLVAPLILCATISVAVRHKWPPIRALLFLGFGLLVLSCIAGIVLTYHDHKLAFYFPLTRSWQFTAGAVLALAARKGPAAPAAIRHLAGGLGAASLAVSILCFSRHTPYPGLAALLPTFGAVLLIAGGIGAQESVLMRMLASPPAVAIGVLSYSWYLWHWPALSFVRALDLAPSQMWKDLAACAAALALAVPTYLLVEQPMKRLREHGLGQSTGKILATGIGVSATLAVLTYDASRGLESGNGQTERMLAASMDQAPGCRQDSNALFIGGLAGCVLGPTAVPRALMWGDSFALALMPLAEKVADLVGDSTFVLTSLACPPLLDIEVDFNSRMTCWDSNQNALHILGTPAARSITGAILVARWALYDGEDPPAVQASEVYRMIWHDPQRTPHDFGAMLEESLGATLEQLADRRILLVGPLPEFRHSAPTCMRRAKLYSLAPEGCAMDRALVESRGREALRTLRRLAEHHPNVKVIDPIDVFCDSTLCRSYGAEGVYFSDDNHVTPLGAELIYRWFQKEWLWVYTGG